VPPEPNAEEGVVADEGDAALGANEKPPVDCVGGLAADEPNEKPVPVDGELGLDAEPNPKPPGEDDPNALKPPLEMALATPPALVLEPPPNEPNAEVDGEGEGAGAGLVSLVEVAVEVGANEKVGLSSCLTAAATAAESGLGANEKAGLVGCSAAVGAVGPCLDAVDDDGAGAGAAEEGEGEGDGASAVGVGSGAAVATGAAGVGVDEDTTSFLSSSAVVAASSFLSSSCSSSLTWGASTALTSSLTVAGSSFLTSAVSFSALGVPNPASPPALELELLDANEPKPDAPNAGLGDAVLLEVAAPNGDGEDAGLLNALVCPKTGAGLVVVDDDGLANDPKPPLEPNMGAGAGLALGGEAAEVPAAAGADDAKPPKPLGLAVSAAVDEAGANEKPLAVAGLLAALGAANAPNADGAALAGVADDGVPNPRLPSSRPAPVPVAAPAAAVCFLCAAASRMLSPRSSPVRVGSRSGGSSALAVSSAMPLSSSSDPSSSDPVVVRPRAAVDVGANEKPCLAPVVDDASGDVTAGAPNAKLLLLAAPPPNEPKPPAAPPGVLEPNELNPPGVDVLDGAPAAAPNADAKPKAGALLAAPPNGDEDDAALEPNAPPEPNGEPAAGLAPATADAKGELDAAPAPKAANPPLDGTLAKPPPVGGVEVEALAGAAVDEGEANEPNADVVPNAGVGEGLAALPNGEEEAPKGEEDGAPKGEVEAGAPNGEVAAAGLANAPKPLGAAAAGGAAAGWLGAGTAAGAGALEMSCASTMPE